MYNMCCFGPPVVSETSPEGLEDVTEKLWDTQALMGTMAPKAGLIEHTENLVVMAIMPDIEQIQGMMRTSSCLISCRDFGNVKVKASGLLYGVRGADAWGGSSPTSGFMRDAPPREQECWPLSLGGISCSVWVLINRQDLYKNSTKAGN